MPAARPAFQPTNVAVGKSAAQSTDFETGHTADVAVDGSTDNLWTHTNGDANPYWCVAQSGQGHASAHANMVPLLLSILPRWPAEARRARSPPACRRYVDLGSPTNVYGVRIYFRTDCCFERNADFEVRLVAGHKRKGQPATRLSRRQCLWVLVPRIWAGHLCTTNRAWCHRHAGAPGRH